MVFSHLTLLILSYLLRQGSDAAGENGELYLEKLLKKESVADKPEYLFFTAPYKVCAGGCTDGNDTNFAMAFPLFLGTNGRTVYKQIYPNDKRNLSEIFKKKPTTPPLTTCPTEKRTANLKSKSTGYPGYEYSTVPTLSTYYDGYKLTTYKTKNAQITTTYHTGNHFMRTRSTHYTAVQELRKILNNAFSGGFSPRINTIPGIPTRVPYIKTLRSESYMFSKPDVWSRPTQRPMIPQGFNIAGLKMRKHNQLPLFGFMPVLPITSKQKNLINRPRIG